MIEIEMKNNNNNNQLKSDFKNKYLLSVLLINITSRIMTCLNNFFCSLIFSIEKKKTKFQKCVLGYFTLFHEITKAFVVISFTIKFSYKNILHSTVLNRK